MQASCIYVTCRMKVGLHTLVNFYMDNAISIANDPVEEINPDSTYFHRIYKYANDELQSGQEIAGGLFKSILIYQHDVITSMNDNTSITIIAFVVIMFVILMQLVFLSREIGSVVSDYYGMSDIILRFLSEIRRLQENIDATGVYDTDREPPPQSVGYRQPIEKERLEVGKKYFCVAIWGLGPCHLLKKFNKVFRSMYEQLHDGTIAGVVAVDGGGSITRDGARVKVENFTVWNERSDMLKFFHSQLHQDAVAAFEGQIAFRVRRFWCHSGDLPDAKDRDSVNSFWTEVKSDNFEAFTGK